MENKRKMVLKQPIKKNPKYKLRKLSIGVVSFMCGYAIFFGAGSDVHAEEMSTPESAVIATINEEANSENISNKEEVSNNSEASNNTEIAKPTEETNKIEVANTDDKVNNQISETKALVTVVEDKKENITNNNASVDTNITPKVEEDINISNKKDENTKNNTVNDKSAWPSMIADRSDEGKPLKEGTGFYETIGAVERQPGGSVGTAYSTGPWPKTIPAPASATETATATETVQPLGGWTNPRMGILPDNLSASYAPNQGKGKVIEYTLDQWNAASNHDQFGWKPIGTKVGITKDGLNGVGIATPNGEGTLASHNMLYQDGFIPNSQTTSSSGNNNALILANYADRDSYKGVYRLVDVRGEKELSWKSSYSAYNVYVNPETDSFDVKFYNNETNSLLATKHVNTRYLQDATGVFMIPSGTNIIKVELVPSYNSISQWNTLNQYGYGTKDRFNVLIDGFELYKTSKMKDALPEDEKIQIFKNGSTGTYNFTVKNASPHEAGKDGGAQIAPYLSNGTNGPVLDWSKAGVNLKFEDKLPSAAVSDNKTTLFDYGMNNQQSQFASGASQKLELKTIDLRENTVDRPQLINVDAYKLNYSTQAKSFISTFNANNYIRREYTDNDTAYHQDVVANSAEAAASYGDKLTDKIVGESATGRSIIILMDKTKLQEAVKAEKLKSLKEGDYTPEAWQKYQEKLTRAEAILKENEELSYLKDDTFNKLNSMAGQSEINTLASVLPTILVKAPTIAGGTNGSITSTPAEDVDKMTVNYKDGDKDITVEVTRTNTSAGTPEAAPTYSWNLSKVITKTGEAGIPVETNEDPQAPEGVSVDATNGMVTIQPANINQGSTITAKDINANNQESKATTFTPATFTSAGVTYVEGQGTEEAIKDAVTAEAPSTVEKVTKEIVGEDGHPTTIPESVGEHTVKVKVSYTKDGIETSTIQDVTVKVAPTTTQGNASYLTTAENKAEIVKDAFTKANEAAGITINGDITVRKVDEEVTSNLPNEVKESDGGLYTVTGRATITKDGINYENQEVTVKVKVVAPATFTSAGVTYVEGQGTEEAIKDAVTAEAPSTVEKVTKEIVGEDGHPTTIPESVGEHTVKVKVSYTKDGIETSTIQDVTVKVAPTTTATINPPLVIAQNDGSVTITPAGNDADTIKVGFVDNDEAGTKIAITANKNEQGKWSLENPFTGVGIDSESGVITINPKTAKADTEVTAQAENKAGTKSTEAKATVKAVEDTTPAPQPPTEGEAPTPQPETPDATVITIKAPQPLAVYNPFDLTEKEREALVEDIKKANTQITDWNNYTITVNPSGNVEITTTKPNTSVKLYGFSFFRAIGGPDMVYPSKDEARFEGKNLPVYPSYLDPRSVDLNKLFENEKINITVPENMTPEAYIEEMKKSPTEGFKEEVVRAVKSALEKQGWPMDRVDVTYKSLPNVFELEYYVPETGRVNTNGAEKVVFEYLTVPEYNALEKPYKVTVMTNNKPSGGHSNSTTPEKPNVSEKPSTDNAGNTTKPNTDNTENTTKPSEGSEKPNSEPKPNTSTNNKNDSKQEASANKDNSEIRSRSGNKLPQTGDTTDVGMYAGLAGLSLLGIFAGFKRRKEEETE